MPKKVSEVLGCDGCPMKQLYPDNTFVGVTIGTGQRLVIGEAPGEAEQKQGAPLVGPTGGVFDGLLSKAGIQRSTLTIINTMSCRPPKNKFPDSEEAREYISKEDGIKAIKQCVHNHVKPLLESRKWERVDLLGGKALKYVGQCSVGITSQRGFQIEIDTDKL